MRRLVIATVVLTLSLDPGAVFAAEEETPVTGDPTRVVELEMVGSNRFLRGDEKVRDIVVIPGETIVFRVDNTAGRELSFSLGSSDRICDPSRSPRWTIPAWAEGTRELTWIVPARAVHLRWGHRGRNCELGTFSDGSQPPNDQTPSFPRATGHLSAHLAHSEQGISFDADFEDTTSAVVWHEFIGDPWTTLYLSRSDDAGLGDFTTRDVANDVEDQSVAICGADAVVGYLQRAPGDDRRLQLARLPGDGSMGSSVEVRAPVEKRGTIEVACTADRAYVAWTELVDGDWHALISTISLPDLQPVEVHDAGPAKRYRIAVAVTEDHALLAWQEGAFIRLGRFRADPDDGQLVPLSTRTIAKRGRNPILDADGARVAVGFDRGNRYFILTSRDGGKAFDRRARFGRPVQGGPREIDSLAIRGRDVVATMLVYYGGDAWDRHRLRSQDRGRTWTRSPIADPGAAIPNDGFLMTPDGVKAAEAYTDGEYADKYDLRVRREK